MIFRKLLYYLSKIQVAFPATTFFSIHFHEFTQQLNLVIVVAHAIGINRLGNKHEGLVMLPKWRVWACVGDGVPCEYLFSHFTETEKVAWVKDSH